MDTILNLVAAAGLAGSLALLGWGMVLCLAHEFDIGGPADAGARALDTTPPAGTLLL